MKQFCKKTISCILILAMLATTLFIPGGWTIPGKAAWTEYTSWSGWSSWQDAYVAETDLCDVDTQTVNIYSTKTVYHYYRYATSEGASSGSYAQSSSYPNKYTYTFDYELETTTPLYGHTRYMYWHSASNWRGVYADSPYTTQEQIVVGQKTQYRYRTRSLIYYYTVSYNANGGSGTPAAQTKTSGTALTLSSTVPTKQYTITFNANGGAVSTASKTVSCTFNHWKASNGSTYGKGASYTANADTTMTAQWTNPSAGTLATPSRTGYTFNGWYTAASGGTQVTSATTISANTTLYAQWKANTFNVKYNGNGHTEGVMSNSVHTYDVQSNLTANTFLKKGYTFKNWNTAANGTGTPYADAAAVKNLVSAQGATVELYAQWSPNTYTVKYDGNGNTTGTMDDTVHIYDLAANLRKNTYAKAHYLFQGWNTKADGTGTWYQDSDCVLNLTETNDETYILYAQWKINEYAVSFDANGGTDAPATQFKVHDHEQVLPTELPVKTYTVHYDLTVNADTASHPDPLEAEQSVNSTFDKWNTAKDGSGIFYAPGDIYLDNQPLHLYAQWSGALNVELPTPNRNGYHFTGWSGTYDLIDDTIRGITVSPTNIYKDSTANFYGDVTLTAQWVARQYTVHLDAAGGTCSQDSVTVMFDSSFGALPTPVKPGYYFVGWFTSETEGIQIHADTKVNQSDDITLYAHWQPKNVASISVDEELSKTVYYVGDTFDPSLITVVLTYEDGEAERTTSGFTCSTPTLNKVSQKRVTVTYGDWKAYVTIDIITPPIASISVKSLPQKTIYHTGDTLSTDGFVLEAVYANGYTQNLTDGYTLEYDFSAGGQQNVKVLYTMDNVSVETSFTVTVIESPRLYSDVSEGTCGELLSIPVYITHNTGIMGFGIEVAYDNKAMKPVSVKASSMLNGAFDNSISVSGDNSFKVYWTGSENMVEDGLLFTMEFEISDNAHGCYDITLTNIPDDTFNEAWESVKLSCAPVSVLVGDVDGEVTTLYADNFDAQTGTTVEVPIKVVNNGGWEALSLTVEYDQEVFKPISVSDGFATVTHNNVDTASGMLNIDLNAILPSQGDGVVCNITFEIAYGKSGEYSLIISTPNEIKCNNATVNIVDGPPVIFAGNTETADNIVSVPVYILGNTGLMGFKLNFDYDASILAPKAAIMGDMLSAGLSDNTISSENTGSFSVIWAGSDDVLTDGKIITLQFEILNSAVDHADVSVSYSQADTYNSQWQDVALKCENIKVPTALVCTHTNTAVQNTKAATCVVEGYTGDTVCLSCGEIVTNGKTLPKISHTYAGEVTTNPTCETPGVQSFTCTYCGDSYVEPVAATGHNYQSVFTPPTCTEVGYITSVCQYCANSFADELAALGHHYEDGKCIRCGESSESLTQPILTLKSPTLEFKDMICINAFYTAENIQDVVEMGMITYSSKVSVWNINTAEHIISGATYVESSGRYYSSSQGIHAKYLGDTVYLAIYAKLSDGSYAYSKLAGYSAVQYATSQLKNSTDVKLKQLVAAMLNYGAEAQLYFGHNTGALANASLTAEQKSLPEAYHSDMVGSVPAAPASKQGTFTNNSGFTSRKPAISFEGAFCINYFFTPKYAPTSGITLYYWNEADYNSADVLTTANATGKLKLEGSGTGEYRGDISGISAKKLSEAVYVAAAYRSGGSVWTSGVLGYSIGAYCSSQAGKGGSIAGLAMATAVYGYHAKQYFG